AAACQSRREAIGRSGNIVAPDGAVSCACRLMRLLTVCIAQGDLVMKTLVVAFTLLLCLRGASAQDAAPPAYLDPSKPTEQRIADLIGRMTLEEKAQQLNHLNVGIPRLKVAAWGGWNQTLHGVWSKRPTTLFPAAIAMGATWDPALVHTITGAMSDEARALYNIGADGPRSKHGLVFRSPVINISRDPRWGR